VRSVKPEVFLIAQPTVDFDEVVRYLTEVGVEEPWQVVNHMSSDEGEALVEIGGKLCYRSWEPGLNVNVTKIREDPKEYLGNILRSGHGSVLEHANYSFILHNVSRVLTHELVRHRAGMAYSQESLRFVRLTDIPFWFPTWALLDTALVGEATLLLEHMEEFQLWMARHFKLDDENVPFEEKKHKTSFMRRFAPEGVATGILATVNVRALRHIIHMRTALGAEEEIRLVMDQVAEKTLEAVPNLMQDFDPNEHREWIPKFLKEDNRG
jgi:thymidylate synthase (FAD)